MSRRGVLLTLVAFLAVPGLFLFSPPRPPTHSDVSCPKRVDVARHLHVHVSCDSPTFVRLALRPAGLFEPEQPRQSRPVFVAVVAGVAAPLRVVARAVDARRVPVGNTLGEKFSGFRPGEDLDDDDAVASYAAHLLVNAGAVLLALVLFGRLVGQRDGDAVVVLALALFLVGNQVVKTSFWTPHTQMLNVLGPVLMVAVGRRLLLDPLRSPRALAGAGFLAGTLTLAYGVLAVLLPVLAVAQWLGVRRLPPGERRVRPSPVPSVAVLAAACAAPVLTWVLLVVARNGTYHSGEVAQYRQFVWVLDAARQGVGPLLDQAADFLGQFARASAVVLWLPAALLAVSLLAWRRAGGSWAALPGERRATLEAAALAFVGVGLFYATLGYYQPRLSWALVPPVLVACGVLVGEACRALRRVAQLAVVGIVLAASLGSLGFEVVRHGPYA